MVTYRQVLGNRRFFKLWLAHFISTFGDWLAIMALVSLTTFREHASAGQVSYLLIALLLPQAVVGPLVGVFVDRWNLKATMIASDLARAVIVLLLMLPQTLPPVYLLVLALSTVSSFFIPAQMAALPSIVGKDQLLVANAINSQTYYLTRILGPAIAGLMVGGFAEHVNACFALDSLSFAFSAALIATIALARRSPDRSAARERSMRAELAEALRFVASRYEIAFLSVAVMLTVFSIGFIEVLVPLYVRDLLRGDARIVGALLSLSGAGTVAGCWLVGRFGQRRPELSLMAAGIAEMGLMLVAFTAVPRTGVALAAAFAFGLGVAAIVVSSNTLLQRATPQEMLGRAGSTVQSLVTAAHLVGLGAAGALAARVGLRNVFYLVGAVLVGVGLAAGRWGGRRGPSNGPGIAVSYSN